MKSYSLGIKQFISSQYVSTGLKITACVLLPAILLQYFGLLGTMMGIPLGALLIALTDQPGPLHHRSNGMIASIIINFFVVCIAGASAFSPWLVGAEVLVLSFLFSMFGVYGARADVIGLIALIAFFISYGTQSYQPQPFINTAIYFSAGGAWYALFSIITNTIQPYRPAMQLLGEYLGNIGEYLRLRSGFYSSHADINGIVAKLIPHQVTIQQQQAALRELMFKTRLFLKEPTNKGRRLMMIFLESTDLLERIMTAQQDYTQLHQEFDRAGILSEFESTISQLGETLVYTGLAVQNDRPYRDTTDIDRGIARCRDAFFRLRSAELKPANMAGFIRLRHILYSIEDLADRIKRIQEFTHPSSKPEREVRKEDLAPFTSSQQFNIRLFLSSLSLKSSQFRHALRFTIAMALGYAVSLFFSVGYGYWILLTIATILKPAFSISRKRNIERVAGTLLGVGLAFLTLHFSADNNTVVLVVMVASMLVAYTYLRINNLVSTAGITLYVVLSFHFFYPAGVGTVLQDRIIDTIIGAAIALFASYSILPAWEHRQIRQLLQEAISRNREYYESVTKLYQQQDSEAVLQYKLARKAAFLALANLSEALERMLNEPKAVQKNLPEYHQLVTANHMLTSYIASLAYYAGQHAGKYDTGDFRAMMRYVCRQFEVLQEMLERPGVMVQHPDPVPVNKKLKSLLEQRKTELESASDINASSVRKAVSVLKSINDQLKLVNAAVEDMKKVIAVVDRQ